MNNIYEIIEKNNIVLTETDIDNNAYYLEINSMPVIMLNNNLKGSKRDLVLAEECAHYKVGVTPTLPFADDYYTKLIRSKNEFQAFKWMQSNLLPEEIENSEYDTIWDLSDRFQLPVEFIEKAIKYRKENQNG